MMATLVNQGIIDLDMLVADVIPILSKPLRDELRIRHTWSHMHGLRHLGISGSNDYEELLAPFLPSGRVERFMYGGAASRVGGSIVELVSGEALPQFCKRHILDPLELKDTDLRHTQRGVRTTVSDAAKIAQLFLNGGAYGNVRLFSPDALALMMPIAIRDNLSQSIRRSIGPSVRWGIGLHSAARLGQPTGVYGHADAKSTAFLIDPVHRLFIVMGTTKRLEKFGSDAQMRLWEAVVAGIKKPERSQYGVSDKA